MSNLKAVVIHGTGGYPERNWFPWLKSELESLGVETAIPRFPTTVGQSLESWRKVFNDQIGVLTPSHILIGHSIGAGFALNLLNQSTTQIKGTILVAGFLGALGQPQFDPFNESFFSEAFDWERIRKNSGKLFVYAGDDDPYVAKKKGLELSSLLKSELTVIHRGGHLNQDSGFKEFPRLLQDLKEYVL